MSEKETIHKGEYVPVNADDEAIFTIRYNKKDELVINWNQFPDPNELIKVEQPSLDAKSRKHLLGSFALRGVIYEGAYVGLGGTDLVPGTTLDLVGGAALLGLAGYTAKRKTTKFRSNKIEEIEKKSKKRERNPERILRVPKLTLSYTAREAEEALDTYTDANSDTIVDVELISEFAERYNDPDLIRFVDPEAYVPAKEESDGLLHEKMEIFIKKSYKRRNKKFKPEHVTSSNYRHARSHLTHWDFKLQDKQRINAIESRMAELSQITKLPPVDDKPTWYIDIQKVVGICAQWLNDHATTPEVLADIYEISCLSGKASNDDPKALHAISAAVNRLVEHSVYAT